MFARCVVFCTALASFVGVAHAQARRDTQALAATPAASADEAAPDDNSAPQPTASGSTQKWRTPGAAGKSGVESTASAAGQPALRPAPTGGPRQPIARVTPGPNTLPNDAGQEWRDYDISPYTARVTSTNRPEQAIRDWILRETGYEAWHGDVVAVLRADHRTLSVYHTPEMHAVVSEMVDRFVNTEAESQAFGMRVITIGRPELAGQGPPHAASGGLAIGRRAGLADGQGRCIAVAGRPAQAQRFPGTQHAAFAGQQRPIDDRSQDAQPQLHPRRDSQRRRLARLRAADGPVRRRLQARVPSRCCRSTAR